MTMPLDPRYAAIMHRDHAADGRFVYGVTTTHVFCRPSCGSRTPHPGHVEYFATPEAALQAGFRPCRRCRPLGDAPGLQLLEACVATPLGDMVAIGCGAGVALLEFADRPMLQTQRERVRRLFSSSVGDGTFPWLPPLERELAEYFAGRRGGFTVPLLPLGTPFQRQVWSRLCEVPLGATTTYEQLGAAIGRPDAARAVGRANGDNRMAILIPCHRVVGSDGGLVGYGGGLCRKRALLELEQARTGLPRGMGETSVVPGVPSRACFGPRDGTRRAGRLR